MSVTKINYYTSCEELPLYNFIKIVCGGSIADWLVIDKSVKTELWELSEIWEQISAEYSELSGDTQSRHVLGLVKEITLLNNKIYIIESAVHVLRTNYEVKLLDLLRSYGFIYPYTPESMQNDLDFTLTSAKKLVFNRREKEAEYGKLTESNNEKSTEKDFFMLIAALNKFLGYRMDAKEISVLEFAMNLNLYQEYNKPTENG